MNNIIPPAAEKKCCPFLPAIPMMSKITPGKVDGIIPADCIGTICAIHDACQGDYSPRALAIKAQARRVVSFKAMALTLETTENFPMIGGLVKKIAESFRVLAAEGME
jgi:hypothetical protein